MNEILKWDWNTNATCVFPLNSFNLLWLIFRKTQKLCAIVCRMMWWNWQRKVWTVWVAVLSLTSSKLLTNSRATSWKLRQRQHLRYSHVLLTLISTSAFHVFLKGSHIWLILFMMYCISIDTVCVNVMYTGGIWIEMFVNVHLFVQDSRDELGLTPDKNCNLQEAAARYEMDNTVVHLRELKN